MSEKYVAEYLEIIDGYGERKGVCVTDTEHTVSFEVKDEYVAMDLCDLLNKQQSAIEELITTIKLYDTDIIEKDKQIKQLQQQLDFIQNNISNAIKHQKTELEQKALKRVISDYNDWLLGHNGEYE